MLVRQANNTDEGLFIMKLPIDLKKIAVGMVASATTVAALAATQGLLGTTSTGNFDITYNVNAEVKLWGLKDINLSASNLSETVQICTYNNNTTNVNFTATSGSGDFTLRSPGNADQPEYSVKLTDKTVNLGDIWGLGGINSGQQGGHKYSSNNNGGTAVVDGDLCVAGSASNTAELTITATTPAASADGTYTDNVTLLIEAI